MAKKLGALVSAKIKKDKLGSEVFSPSYRTGLDILDYRNGRMEGNEVVLGISGGKILSVVGRSGSGKSSLAYKIAGEIIRSHEDAQGIHLDYERAANKARIAKMTGLDLGLIHAESDVYTFLNSNISSETLYQLVKAIYDLKMAKENKADFTITATHNGNKVEYMIPTVIIVDSLVTMTPTSIQEEDELSGSMSASAIAKTNNAIFKRIANFITDANITIITINHITQTISMGTPTKAALNFLKQDESLPGGSSAIFLSDSLLRLETGTKLEEDKEYGIKGFTVKSQYVKSRSNAAGRVMTLVFDQENGFDNVLTNVQYLRENKLLLGSGHGYFIETMPDKKFKLKNVRELYDNDQEFREGFDNYIHELYSEFLSSKSSEAVEEESFMLVECVDPVNNIWKGNDGLNYYYNEATEECILQE